MTKGARVSFADPDSPQGADGTTQAAPERLSSAQELSFGIVKVSSVYSSDLLQAPSADVAIQQPANEDLRARVETRKDAAGQAQHFVVVDLTAARPGFLMDSLTVRLPGRKVRVCVTAKVMAAGKGTPALRSNVHSLGHIETEETDFE